MVHHAMLSPDKMSQWRSAKLTEIGLEKVAEFGLDAVYHIVQTTEPTHQLHIELIAPEQLPAGLDVRIGLTGRGVDHRA